MFKNAKVGDKVWSMRKGWGDIADIDWTSKYPIYVKFLNSGFYAFTSEGKELLSDLTPSIYWDEFRIIPPKKPLPNLPIDTKVLVWDDGDKSKIKAHFHSFNQDGRMVTWPNGCTSFTNKWVAHLWDNWELYEESNT